MKKISLIIIISMMFLTLNGCILSKTKELNTSEEKISSTDTSTKDTPVYSSSASVRSSETKAERKSIEKSNKRVSIKDSTGSSESEKDTEIRRISDSDISYDKGTSDSTVSKESGISYTMDSEKSSDLKLSFSESVKEDYIIPPSPKKTISPSPGILTAGEWNDNDNFDYFKNVLNNNEWFNMQAHWGFYDFDRVEVIINADNIQIPNIKVELLDNQSQILWETRTDSHGRALLFSNLFSKGNTHEDYKLRVTDTDTIIIVNDVKTSETNYIELNNGNDIKISDNVDIMFSIDTTGSMSDELSYLQEELKYVIEEVQRENANELSINVSTNFYRDINDAYTIKPFKFTSNINKVINQINQQHADGGGDYEEAVALALEDAILEHNWREDAKARLLFLVLDAPPHHTQENINKLQNLVLEANSKGIKIIPIASSGVDKNTEFLMRFLDVSTGGSYIFLTDDSGVGNSHIEPTIGYYQVEHLNTLLIRIINKYVQ